MSTRQTLQKLQYREDEHGWAFDTGSFLAAWSTSIRNLAYCEDVHIRLDLIRFARLYAFNVNQRLEQHGIFLDTKAFEPRDLHQIDTTVAEISAKVRRVASSSHRAFLLLGSATSFVELGLKPGMQNEYYAQLRECATAAIQQILKVPGQLPADMDPDALRLELLRLGGNVNSVKKIIAGGQLSFASARGIPFSQRKGPVEFQRELSSSSSEGYCYE